MNKTTRAISMVTVLLIIIKLLGFIREMIVAAYYGATYQTDAYNMAILILGLSTALISTGFATVIVPMYNNKRIHESKDVADAFTSNILCITSLFYVLISIFGIITAPLLVRIFAPDFDIDTFKLTINIIRITFIFTIAINISNFMTFIMQIHGKFSITVVANFPFSIFTVVSIVLFSDKIGIYALVIGYILFLFTQVLILVLYARKTFKFKYIINFTNNELKEVLKLSFPVYISVAVWEINIIIDKVLASGLSEGSISLIMYASKLRSLPDSIITASVIMVIFPLLSKYAAQKEFALLKTTVNKTISFLFMVLFPVIAISIYYAEEITRIVYERGVFTANETALTANLFAFAIISLIFTGVSSLINNLFYSIQDTITPQIAAIIMFASNILFNLLLIRHMQAAGLVLATSIASFIYFIVSIIQFRLKCGAFGGFGLLKNIFKYFTATLGMVSSFFLLEIFRNRLTLFLFFSISAIISLCIYIFLLYLLKAELFTQATVQIKIFFNNQLKRIDYETVNKNNEN